jgi:tetratricopeptide (TPR) repeat protein
LVEKAPDFDTALAWMERMDAGCVEPTARVYETLIEKAEDFKSARALIERMFDRDIQPSETAFISLFSKDISGVPAGDLLAWYLGLRYHPTHPVKRAIAEYRRKGMIEDALRLALDYPHTDTALRLIRKFADRALAYFRSVVERDPDHPNGAYALGMALLETGDSGEAERWLRRAYALATPGTRKDELARFLSLLERVNPPSA